MGLDEWVCCGIVVAADSVGKFCSVLLALLVLPGEISRDVFVESMPALVPGACNLGSLARLTIDPDKAWVCGGFGGGYYGTDDSDVAWAMGVDLQLGADMAGLVHRGNGTTD